MDDITGVLAWRQPSLLTVFPDIPTAVSVDIVSRRPLADQQKEL